MAWRAGHREAKKNFKSHIVKFACIAALLRIRGARTGIKGMGLWVLARQIQPGSLFTSLCLWRQDKNRKHRATGGLDSSLCLASCYTYHLTPFSLLIYQIIGSDHMSSKIPFNIWACSLWLYCPQKWQNFLMILYSHSKNPSLLILWIFVP